MGEIQEDKFLIYLPHALIARADHIYLFQNRKVIFSFVLIFWYVSYRPVGESYLPIGLLSFISRSSVGGEAVICFPSISLNLIPILLGFVNVPLPSTDVGIFDTPH